MTTVEPQHLDNGSGFEMVDAPIMGSSEIQQVPVAAATPPPASAVPDLSDVVDFVADDATAAAANATTGLPAAPGTPEQEQPSEPRSKGLYFVRIPRPNIDDGHVKALQVTFQGHVARVRQLNEKLQTKRGEMIELRKQMALAKSLRDGSQPEFEEKLGRLQELRQMRGTRVTEMRSIRTGLKGLECRSEEELDDKIRELEGQISDGQITIREEKMVVQQITKLRGQRERVRQYESQNKSRLGELEGESSQVKAVISELEAEFNVLKGERDQATKIIQELYEKLKKASEEYSVLEEEQKEVVDIKNEVLEKLNRARADMDVSMKDYRENRKFSLLIRDMVAAGQVDQALQLCEQQVEEWIGKINTDTTYRAEYFKLWSQQRKYLVSELLPNSAPADVPRPDGARGQPGQRGPPPKPQGKQKAEAIIAAALEAATKDLATSGYKPSVADSVSDVEDDISDHEPVTVPVPAARKAAGGDSVFKHKVELPPAALLQSDGFELPAAVRSSIPVPTEELKAKVREENQKKSAEAAARKKRRQDAVDRKRVRAAEAAKRKAEETAALKAAGGAATTSAAEETVTDLSTAENTAEDTDTGADIVAAPLPKPTKPKVIHRTIKAAVEKPVAKLPKTVVKKSKSTLKKWLNDNQVAIVCAVVALIMAVLLILWFSTGK